MLISFGFPSYPKTSVKWEELSFIFSSSLYREKKKIANATQMPNNIGIAAEINKKYLVVIITFSITFTVSVLWIKLKFYISNCAFIVRYFGSSDILRPQIGAGLLLKYI